jgi:hypothetical protein
VDLHLLTTNLTNPTLLFFLLGVLAKALRSDLEIPAASIKFISLYLLFSIGFNGGQELAHSGVDATILRCLALGLGLAAVIPLYTFFALRARLGAQNAGAIAAAYGSVSAVTFVAATGFLEARQLPFGGHMVATMALMESPAIIVGVVLLLRFDRSGGERASLRDVLHHSLTNGSVLVLLGSLLIGAVADAKQAEGIRPFTTDIFKGFLAVFLLEMGMVTAARISALRSYGAWPFVAALILPLVNGCAGALASSWATEAVGDRFMFAVLAASASYIAVPAAMRLAAPKADPGLYIPMALGLTFPLNITMGMPLYLALVERTSSP